MHHFSAGHLAALVLLAASAVPAAAQTAAALDQPQAVEASVSDLLGDGFAAAEDDSEYDVLQTALFQPPAAEPARTPARAPARRGGPRQGNILLADVPPMFGDFGMMSATAQFVSAAGNRVTTGSFDIPGAGGSRRVKIGENNSPIPQDRVVFMYNHFHNVYQFSETAIPPTGPAIQRQFPIDRYIVGLEKTFLDGWASVEVRMPFNGSLDVAGPTFAVNGGNYGNLAVIAKRLLYLDDSLALAAGLGLDLPTGSSAEAQIGPAQLTFRNQSTHLLPYFGAVAQATDNLFLTGFLQVDVAASGNDVLFGPVGGRDRTIGTFTEQNLLYADLGGGYWIYRDPTAEWVNGVAALLEFHYTTSLQQSDAVAVESGLVQTVISNPFNWFDVVNVTTGVNIAFSNTAFLRVAGVFPLSDAPDRRFFDSEVQVQFNHRY